MRISRKTMIVSLLVAPLLVFAFIAGAVFLVPEQTVPRLIRAAMFFGKLHEKQVRTKSGTINYLEGGQGETIVILHGLYSRKENWLLAADILASQYRVIVPDLPGFGANDLLGDDGYRFSAQMTGVKDFLNAVNVEKFHVAGSSMGGLLAAMIAEDEPERVTSLAFLGSPAGLFNNTKSEMDRAMAKGRFPLIVRNAEQYWERFRWLDENPSYLAKLGARGYLKKEVESVELNQRIWDEVTSASPTILNTIAPKITQPALIVWCRQDRVFHVSGAKLLLKLLPRADLQIMENCGHAPILGQYIKTLNHYVAALAYMRSGVWPPPGRVSQ